MLLRGPQARAQVRVERQAASGRARQLHAVLAIAEGGGAERGKDAGHIQLAGREQVGLVELRDLHRAGGRAFAVVLDRGGRVGPITTREQSTPSPAPVRCPKLPKELAPRRLIQPTRRPRRARPIATLVSAPARRLLKCCSSARAAVLSATSRAIDSPIVTTSSGSAVMLLPVDAPSPSAAV